MRGTADPNATTDHRWDEMDSTPGTGWKVIGLGLDPGAGGRGTARCAAGRKDLDNDHAAAAARAWRTPSNLGRTSPTSRQSDRRVRQPAVSPPSSAFSH